MDEGILGNYKLRGSIPRETKLGDTMIGDIKPEEALPDNGLEDLRPGQECMKTG